MTAQLLSSPIAPLTQAQKSQILDLVRRAAQTEIMPRFRKLDHTDIDIKKDETDLVTEADRAAEAMITQGLQSAFPQALVIGEEAISAKPTLRDGLPNAELSFIIDPVDGTWNFAHGMPLFATIIAVCSYGEPVFGLIYDPIGDDAILADNTSKALWHMVTNQQKAIHTADAKPLDRLFGYMPIRLFPPADKIVAYCKLHMLGYVGSLRCSAHEYRMLATGGIDFILAGGPLNAWDHAAGALICAQAGGKSAMLDGSAYNAAVTEGYLLCAGSEQTWNTIADHFTDLLVNA